MHLEFDVGVIGAGIIGATVAAALCEGGLRTALIDRGSCGAAGATSYSGGLVRLYDPDPVRMALAAHSLGCMRASRHGLAFDAALRRTGTVYRAALTESQSLQAAVEQYARPDYPMLLIDDRQLDQINTLSSDAPGYVNLFEPRAGIGDPRQATRSMAALLAGAGPTACSGLLLEHAEVTAIETGPDGAHIHLGTSRLHCRVVVVATGAWAARLLPALALQTRSIPLARITCVEAAAAAVPVIDTVAGTYAIALGGHVIQAGSQLRHAAAFPEQLPMPGDSSRAPEPLLARQGEDAMRRLSQLQGRPVQGTVLDVLPGFDGYTADGRPLVGFLGADSPVFVATGMNGLGFKLAPGIADIALGQIRKRLLGQTLQDPQGWHALLSPLRQAAPAAALAHAPALSPSSGAALPAVHRTASVALTRAQAYAVVQP